MIQNLIRRKKIHSKSDKTQKKVKIMLFTKTFSFKIMLLRKDFFSKIVFFEIQRKMQNLSILRGKINQNVFFVCKSAF